MDSDYSSQQHAQGAGHRRTSAWTVVAVGLTAFLLGGMATVWAIRHEWQILPLPDVPKTILDRPGPTPAQPPLRPASIPGVPTGNAEQTALQQAGFDARLAALEQRLTRLDLQAQAGSGNAARAEGLLIAFATRRALERGAPLGYLADQLRLRFGNAQPNAVRAIIEASRDPVTLDQLVARLEGMSQNLATAPSEEGLWHRVRREVDGLFVIRRESAPSPAPRMRLERARMFLESGRIEAAVDEVRNMPGAADAGNWIADAERYASTQIALELIETTAILEPRELRDGAGQTVAQPSPVEAKR